eukprot:2975162-Pleurochrysis_carterae.AAC.1
MVSRLLRPLLTLDALDARGCTVGCDCDVPLYSSVAATERSVAVARAVAAASAVLLKNEGGALPLSRGARVALLGDACGAPHEIDPVRERWTKGDYYVRACLCNAASFALATCASDAERRRQRACGYLVAILLECVFLHRWQAPHTTGRVQARIHADIRARARTR